MKFLSQIFMWVFVGPATLFLSWAAFDAVFVGTVFGPIIEGSASAQALEPEVITFGQGSAGTGWVGDILGVLQFVLAVLSGLVIVVAVVMAYSVGRTQREQRIALDEERRFMRDMQARVTSAQREAIESEIRNKFNQLAESESGLISEQLSEMQSSFNAAQDMYLKLKPVLDTLVSSEEDLIEFADRQTAEALIVPDNVEVMDKSERERRIQVFSLLNKIERAARQRKITGNKAYNAAQEAARHDFDELAHRIAASAYWLSSTPVNEIRLRRSEVQRGDRFTPILEGAEMHLRSENPTSSADVAARIRDEALRQTRELLQRVPLASNHLFYAEAWNVTSTLGRFDILIDGIEDSIRRSSETGIYITSYGHATLAQAYAHQGDHGWKTAAYHHLNEGFKKFSEESPLSSWYRTSKRELIMRSKALSFDLDQVIQSGVLTDNDVNEVIGLSPGGINTGMLRMMAERSSSEPVSDDASD